MKDKVSIELTKEETIVFFEWLGRYNNGDSISNHKAEELVLWKLETILEAKLEEPFLADFPKILSSAQQSIIASNQ